MRNHGPAPPERTTPGERRREASEIAAELPPPTWRHYDRLPAGEYVAYCRRTLTYFDRGFKRFTCLLLWDVLSRGGENVGQIRMWLNLGPNNRATRRSRYWKEWNRATARPSARGDRLTARVFGGRIARILVCDSASEPPYSVVREILSWETGLPKKQTQSRSKTQSLNDSTKAGEKPRVGKKLSISDVNNKASALAGVEGSKQSQPQRRAMRIGWLRNGFALGR